MPGHADPPQPMNVLFVCTGNTCRSPLAAALAGKILGERFGCRAIDLPARGIAIGSAGVATWGGLPASPEAEAAGREVGVDLSGHRSRAVDADLLAAATDVIAMTAGHAALLRARFPGVGPAPVLLGGTADLDDPIGADAAVYRACVETIHRHLTRFFSDRLGPP